MQKSATYKLCVVAIISALYAVLSLIAFPIASSSIQLRIGEGLCLLPLIFPESCLSLCVGCLIVNVLTGCPLYDVILGAVISLISGVLTALIGKFIKSGFLKIFLGGLFPVILNAFFLPLIWLIYGGTQYVYIVNVLFIAISEIISVYGIGIPVLFILKKLKLFGDRSG